MNSSNEEKLRKMTELWYWPRMLDDGRLSDKDTKSEYERGWIDCWNELWKSSFYLSHPEA